MLQSAPKPYHLTWLSIDECANQRVWIYEGPRGPTRHMGLNPQQWENVMLDCMIQPHKNFYKVFVECMPPPCIDYGIDLFLAETSDTLNPKIAFINKQTNNKYDSLYIWQGTRLAKRLYELTYYKDRPIAKVKDKMEACRKFLQKDGLPFYPIVVSTLGLNQKALSLSRNRQWKPTLNQTKQYLQSVCLPVFLTEFKLQYERSVICMFVIRLSYQFPSWLNQPKMFQQINICGLRMN